MHGHWHKFHTTQYFWRMVHHATNYQQILSNICEMIKLTQQRELSQEMCTGGALCTCGYIRGRNVYT